MSAHPFISDNPFRMLCVGSSLPMKELRQKASSVEMAARVGMAPEAALTSQFGSDETEHCVSIVRALVLNPTELTIHRILWPFEMNTAIGPIDDIESLIKISEVAPELAQYKRFQLSFLDAWFTFLLEFNPALFTESAEKLRILFEDGACTEFLKSLLIADGEAEDKARAAVHDAQLRTASLMLNEGCKRAVECWENSDYSGSILLLECMSGSGIQDQLVDSALQEIVPFFDREIDSLRKIEERFGVWSPEGEQFDPGILVPYRKLANALEKRTPSARLMAGTGR